MYRDGFSLIRFFFLALSFFGAIYFLRPSKNSVNRASTLKMTLLRIAIVLVIWAFFIFLGVLCFKSAFNDAGFLTASGGTMAMIWIGVIIGILTAYFWPVPKKWREAATRTGSDNDYEKKEVAKINNVLFRIALFFSVWAIISFFGKISPSKNDVYSIRIIGLIIGILVAYYWPAKKMKGSSSLTGDETMLEENIPESVDTNLKDSKEETLVYEKEEIEL